MPQPSSARGTKTDVLQQVVLLKPRSCSCPSHCCSPPLLRGDVVPLPHPAMLITSPLLRTACSLHEAWGVNTLGLYVHIMAPHVSYPVCVGVLYRGSHICALAAP